MNLSKLKKEIKKQSSKPKAKFLQRFFKTGRGGYAEGDLFLGLTVPQSRLIARTFTNIELREVLNLINSKYHEERLIALLILVDKFGRGSSIEKEKVYKFYLRNIKFVNNWDLVDLSADKIIGAYLASRSKDILNRLSHSKNIWERRIAILATFNFIKRNDFTKTLEFARRYLSDKHDLIHKATGWMLREIGNRDEKTLIRFLDKNYKQMPRTALRYALERLNRKQKNYYMKK